MTKHLLYVNYPANDLLARYYLEHIHAWFYIIQLYLPADGDFDFAVHDPLSQQGGNAQLRFGKNFICFHLQVEHAL